MALPNYDSTKHHIGLAATGGQLKGYLIDGGYRCDPQKASAPPEYGGERDLVEPTVLSRWTQDDFSGGAYQEIFSNDPAMFAFSKNFLPNQIERSARTVPPLFYFSGAGAVDANASLGVYATGGSQIAVADSDKIRFYNAETGVLIATTDPGYEIQAATHDPTDNKIYAITKRTSDGRKFLKTFTTAAAATIDEFPASPDTATARGIEVTGGRDVLVAFNNLWLADINAARDAAVFTTIGRLPGVWRDSVSYNGLTYILLTDGAQSTQVIAWDGSQILPVTTFPYNFIGKAIAIYGGRIYVCGSGTDIAGADRYGELYEITGSSLRLVRTFAWEARAGLACPKVLYEMAVHEGLLFVGTDQGYLIAYDLTRDALWSRIDIVPSVVGRTVQVRRLLSTREKLFAWCYDPNRTTPADGFYRMAALDADMGGTTQTSYVETSDFSPEVGRDKKFSSLRLQTRYGVAPTLEYSLDGGTNFTSVSGSSSGAGSIKITDFDLTTVAISPQIRFRISFAKNVVALTELIAMTMEFLFLDTGKRGWNFAILGADFVEQSDATSLDQDTALIKSTLWGFWSNRTTLDFKDLDGTTSPVILSNISENQPHVAPPLSDGSREAFFAVELTEV